MHTERDVLLFKNGPNQALHIPHDFKLPGDEAIIRKEGNRLIVEPVARQSLLAGLDTLEPLNEDFSEIETPPKTWHWEIFAM